jgi:acetoacetyl-[acyl-carrier protein] synthase
MTALPVIVGFGGVGPAGRSSFHHAYHRTVYESLPEASKRETVASLASMMKLAFQIDGQLVTPEHIDFTASKYSLLEQAVLKGTLIRELESNIFDPENVAAHTNLDVQNSSKTNSIVSLKVSDLPSTLPLGWNIMEEQRGIAKIKIQEGAKVLAQHHRRLPVTTGGQLPSGFDPAELYNSRFHPRGLQLAIVAASDAIKSMGIEWQTVLEQVHADEVAVYAASAMGQLDKTGTGGMLKARLEGNRTSAKQLPLGLNNMPADFINAYVLGSIGSTGANVGACASFLYNLRAGVEDIQSGRRKVVVVGNAEAPLTPEIIEGYAAMSALATDENLCKLDSTKFPDHRRASRPFGENCGFTLGESGQYFVLMNDQLALELGANIHGAVTDVFVNADGFKKSISAPGPGNYITLGKALSAASSLLGSDAIKERSFIQAHGSSTPQNRVTETQVFDKVARAFGITNWPVTAVKAFLGHSLAPASADQLVNTLGVLKYGVLPGIKTLDKLADDLFDERLSIALTDTNLTDRAEVGFLNSKGFGGNNATGIVLSPMKTEAMLTKRFGNKAIGKYKTLRDKTTIAALDYDKACMSGPMKPIYNFGQSLISDDEIKFEKNKISISGFPKGVNLESENKYKDLV